jgi:hypothetical protein
MAEPVTTLTPAEAAALEAIVGRAPGGALLTASLPVAAPSGPAVAEIRTMPPEVSFLTTRIPPPTPFYLAREDRVVVTLWNSVAGATIFLGARFLRPDGVLVPEVQSYSPTSDRTANTFNLTAREGYLLGLHIGTQTVSQPGLCFCTVLVTRPGLPLGNELHTLLAGYVTNSYHPNWPGTALRDLRDGQGALRVILGTQPAAGAEIAETVPTNARWRLYSLTVNLVDGGGAAARFPTLAFDDGATIYSQVGPDTQANGAGATHKYSWVAGGGSTYFLGGSINLHTIGIEPDIRLRAGHRIRTLTDSLQAGDQWGVPQYLVEEWIDT